MDCGPPALILGSCSFLYRPSIYVGYNNCGVYRHTLWLLERLERHRRNYCTVRQRLIIWIYRDCCNSWYEQQLGASSSNVEWTTRDEADSTQTWWRSTFEWSTVNDEIFAHSKTRRQLDTSFRPTGPQHAVIDKSVRVKKFGCRAWGRTLYPHRLVLLGSLAFLPLENLATKRLR